MSESIEIVQDVTGTHAHYYLTNEEEPRGCLVLRDDAGTVQYLFRDGSVLECYPDAAPVALTGDPTRPQEWQMFVTTRGQWQKWSYDQERQTWSGIVQVTVPDEDVRPLVPTDWDTADAEICGGDDEHDAAAYINVAQGPGGYYVSVGLDAGHFTAELAEDDGPYQSHEAAVQAGRDAAIDWFIDNNLYYEGEDDE